MHRRASAPARGKYAGRGAVYHRELSHGTRMQIYIHRVVTHYHKCCARSLSSLAMTIFAHPLSKTIYFGTYKLSAPCGSFVPTHIRYAFRHLIALCVFMLLCVDLYCRKSWGGGRVLYQCAEPTPSAAKCVEPSSLTWDAECG